MIRARFYIKCKDCGNDYRPIKWPIKHPYWCTGESSNAFIMVAYADSLEQIKELWPEAYNIEAEEVQGIEFTSRFPKPKWYKEDNGKTCKTCVHRQPYRCNSNVFQYCKLRQSNRTDNGLLKIKCKDKACKFYMEDRK